MGSRSKPKPSTQPQQQQSNVVDVESKLKRQPDVQKGKREASEVELGRATQEQLLRSSTAFHDVARFVGVVLQRLLPAALLGHSLNRLTLLRRTFPFIGFQLLVHRYICKEVGRFVAMRRYEKMLVRELMCGVRVSACKWARGSTEARSVTPLARSDVAPYQKSSHFFCSWL
jgi:hypothetical protein